MKDDDTDLHRILDMWKAPTPAPAWIDRVARRVEPMRNPWRTPSSMGAALAAGGLIGFLTPSMYASTAMTSRAASDIAILINWLW